MFNLNRNWGGILLAEVVMVALSLGVFFLCRMAFDMEHFTAINVVAAITISVASYAFVNVIDTFMGAALVAASVTVVSLVDNTIVGTAGEVIIVVGFVTSCVAFTIAEDYLIPKYLVVLAYLAEAALIFFPIFLWGK